MKLLSKNSLLLPTPKKVFLAALLFYLFGWVIWPVTITSLVTDWYPVGFPLTIRAEGLCPPTYVCVEFQWFAVIVDAIVWYGITAAVINSRIRFWIFCLYFLGTILGIWLITVLLIANHIFIFM